MDSKRGKKLRFPLYGAIKPVRSVQTSHEISPRLNGRGSSPRQAGVLLLLCESILSQNHCILGVVKMRLLLPASRPWNFFKMPNAQLFWPPSQRFPDKSLVIYIFLNTGPPLSSRPVLTRLEGIEELIVHTHLADKQFNSNRGLN